MGGAESCESLPHTATSRGRPAPTSLLGAWGEAEPAGKTREEVHACALERITLLLEDSEILDDLSSELFRSSSDDGRGGGVSRCGLRVLTRLAIGGCEVSDSASLHELLGVLAPVGISEEGGPLLGYEGFVTFVRCVLRAIDAALRVEIARCGAEERARAEDGAAATGNGIEDVAVTMARAFGLGEAGSGSTERPPQLLVSDPDSWLLPRTNGCQSSASAVKNAEAEITRIEKTLDSLECQVASSGSRSVPVVVPSVARRSSSGRSSASASSSVLLLGDIAASLVVAQGAGHGGTTPEFSGERKPREKNLNVSIRCSGDDAVAAPPSSRSLSGELPADVEDGEASAEPASSFAGAAKSASSAGAAVLIDRRSGERRLRSSFIELEECPAASAPSSGGGGSAVVVLPLSSSGDDPPPASSAAATGEQPASPGSASPLRDRSRARSPWMLTKESPAPSAVSTKASPSIEASPPPTVFETRGRPVALGGSGAAGMPQRRLVAADCHLAANGVSQRCAVALPRCAAGSSATAPSSSGCKRRSLPGLLLRPSASARSLSNTSGASCATTAVPSSILGDAGILEGSSTARSSNASSMFGGPHTPTRRAAGLITPSRFVWVPPDGVTQDGRSVSPKALQWQHHPSATAVLPMPPWTAGSGAVASQGRKMPRPLSSCAVTLTSSAAACRTARPRTPGLPTTGSLTSAGSQPYAQSRVLSPDRGVRHILVPGACARAPSTTTLISQPAAASVARSVSPIRWMASSSSAILRGSQTSPGPNVAWLADSARSMLESRGSPTTSVSRVVVSPVRAATRPLSSPPSRNNRSLTIAHPACSGGAAMMYACPPGASAGGGVSAQLRRSSVDRRHLAVEGSAFSERGGVLVPSASVQMLHQRWPRASPRSPGSSVLVVPPPLSGCPAQAVCARSTPIKEADGIGSAFSFMARQQNNPSPGPLEEEAMLRRQLDRRAAQLRSAQQRIAAMTHECEDVKQLMAVGG